MAIAALKIASLGVRRDIPFNKLVLSQANVRRIKHGVSVDTLADSIARRGLLQNLNVRPVLDEAGAETGMFKVPAGGRRFRALELLVKAKRLAKTFPIPCNVRDADSPISEEEDSLAENTEREDLDPIDEYRAFRTLVEERGMGVEEVAAIYAVSPATVRQRLRLAAVSPALIDLYASEEVSLDQLMAFSVTQDHAHQEQVWATIAKSPYRDPHQIRRMLTEDAVRASDRRAQFVGVDAYEAAGGTVLRDLFQRDDGGWLRDPTLLNRLASDKLGEAAQEIAGEGWKWIAVGIEFPYGHEHGLRRLRAIGPVLTTQEQATYDALQTEFATIEEQYSESPDDLPDEVDQRLGEIEAAFDAFDSRPASYDPAEVARAGAFVSLDPSGGIKIERGYVRPEDEALVEPIAPGTDANGAGSAAGGEADAAVTPVVQRAVITIAGAAAEPEPEEDEGLKPLPERLLQELTAHRTLALRDAIAGDPHVALTALLHRLVSDIFARGSAGACLEASVRHVYFPAQATELKDSASARSVDERQKAWAADLPVEDDQALWDWLDALDGDSRLSLLAHCVSFGVNAQVEKVDRYGGAGLSQHALDRRMHQADRLARSVGLDMAEVGWRPTVDNYLGRVTKGRILEAVREGKGEQAAQLIDHLKKPDMAREAERLLADTGWVPEPLRTGADAAVSDDDQPTAEVVALPAFLSGEDDGADADTVDEPEPAHAIAAE